MARPFGSSVNIHSVTADRNTVGASAFTRMP
ncbi:Uncharacterised protein [Mycobacterium tuberculosis]|uniref:Uncharacterized protein n=1 Tax=Mycobacterium tuberculosis TaxID=1773 RepID=A0A916PHE7_MYCTX|nr:Uncharacterised protein [Mycobacterium tuberculosis]